jgi:hypothetical protein
MPVTPSLLAYVAYIVDLEVVEKLNPNSNANPNKVHLSTPCGLSKALDIYPKGSVLKIPIPLPSHAPITANKFKVKIIMEPNNLYTYIYFNT